MTIKLYGIANCDSIKKAKTWLNNADIAFEFHDYRKQGIDAHMVTHFCQQLGWQNVVNKRGTTYRQLDEHRKATLNSDNVIELLTEQPTMIKRPILVCGDSYYLGFKEDQYATIFSQIATDEA